MVSAAKVSKFKAGSNENQLLVKILRKQFSSYISEPILDIGAGSGDIDDAAFHDKKVFLVDLNEYGGVIKNPCHKRLKMDFFDIKKNDFPPIGALCFFHSLQYIDDSESLLAAQIDLINPRQIFIAVNKNDGVMGELVVFFYEHAKNANPEIFKESFIPDKYRLMHRIDFATKFTAKNHGNLIENIKYLMDCPLEKNSERELSKLLRRHGALTTLDINQELLVFERIYGKAK